VTETSPEEIAAQPLGESVLQKPDWEQQNPVVIDIYIAQHCSNCAYAYEVAMQIRQQFPHVTVRLVNMEAPVEPVPDIVFATPTYLLNGRLWSLGNPSPTKVQETLIAFTRV
jgi:hypothetical protein